ncbi:MAG: class I tRNA ligase family protein [Candidatus Paceibacterota bacterium]
MSKNIYITTTLPYVNSDPHVGFAMEIIRADVLARYHGLIGNNVFLNTGTDEHGTKIWEKAQAEGIDVQKYVDSYAEKFKGLSDLLNLSSDIHFIRTTDESHVKAAQEFWKIVDQNGYIYKAPYEAKYCVGCELEKTDSELVDGRCPIHPDKDLELISEENYFFKFSDFTQPLLDFYEQNKNFVLPDFRFNEIKKFVERGLRDFSISRVKRKNALGCASAGR